jgi:hypothetical protein
LCAMAPAAGDRPFLQILQQARGDTVADRKVAAIGQAKLKYDQRSGLDRADWDKARQLSEMVRDACGAAVDVAVQRFENLMEQLEIAESTTPASLAERDALEARIEWLELQLAMGSEETLAREKGRDTFYGINNAMQGLRLLMAAASSPSTDSARRRAATLW